MDALSDAIDAEDISTIETLVQDPDIDVNALINGANVLHYASANGYERVVELLLARPDIQVNIQSEDGYTPLIHSLLENKHSIVQLLLAHPGIDVNLRDNEGETALHVAINTIKDFNYFSVSLLLAFPGIDVNIQDNRGNTPLHYACMDNLKYIVEKLLTFPEINVNLQNNELCTALMYAEDDGSNLLAMPGIALDIVDEDGRTALIQAVEYANLPKVKMLISRGANVNIRSNRGETALLRACEIRFQDPTPFIEAILSRPIDDINYGRSGYNALIRISLTPNSYALRLLLSQKNIDINHKDERGKTPLMRACQGEQVENVRILLSFPGIDVNLKDVLGRTALGMALEENNPEIIRMLIGKGAKYYLKDVIRYYPEFKELNTLIKLYKGDIYEEGVQTRYKRQRVENQQANTQIATTMDIYAVQVLDDLIRSLRLQIPSSIDTSHNFQEVLRYIKTYYYDPIREEGNETFRLI